MSKPVYWRCYYHKGDRTIFFLQHGSCLYFLCRDPKRDVIDYSKREKWPRENDLYKWLVWNNGEQPWGNGNPTNYDIQRFTNKSEFEGEIFLDML